MKRWLTLLSCLISTIISTAQLPCVPYTSAPGHCSSVGGNYWEAFYNPARLSREKKSVGRLFYQNRFFSPELSTVGISYAQPLPWFTGGVALSYFGYDVYQEMLLNMSVAKRYGSWRLGIAIDSHSLYVPFENDYSMTTTGEVGVQLQASKQWEFALHLFNPVYSSMARDSQSSLPVVCRIGGDYHPIESCHILGECSLSNEYGMQLATGMEYQLYPEIALNCGAYYRHWVIPTLGVVLDCKEYALYMNCEWHPVLGVSSLITLELTL